ncbi:MAG: haloacid dehalogenase [Chloroflexi bacterium HGW-Chloroflexi-3]|nr:MAG: haloacid dehalogenase [Chloroflexi bacterium HGW-Chloroflexi-3]
MSSSEHYSPEFLRDIHAIMIDIDGTLMRGNLALPGLVEFFNFLIAHNIRFQVASNNATKTLSAYQQKINAFGANLSMDNILTCSTVTALYLQNKYPGGKVYMIGQSGLEEALTQVGIQIIDGMNGKADAVVVGGDYSLTYEKLKYASLHIQQGAEFIGTNPDLLYPTDEGLVPECGMTLVALETATQVKPVIMGKPNASMFEQGMKKMGVQPNETAMLGDRLETDIQGGKNAGMKTILVETGVDNQETVISKGIQPDLVVEDLFELISLWVEQRSRGTLA